MTATDAERRRIERNLHDGAQQTCSACGSPSASPATGGRSEALDTLLAEIDEELQGAVEELRTLARGVHPLILSDGGSSRRSPPRPPRRDPDADHCGCPHRLPAPVETAAYYVASEALANVLKHARASRARSRWRSRTDAP